MSSSMEPVTTSGSKRFWAKVDRSGPTSCWLWTAAKDPQGYGRFAVGSKRDGSKRAVLAHRYSYELANGPIPEGMVLDHLCRVPACVNPRHLEPCTMRQNVDRGNPHPNVFKTQCPAGHPYDDVNTYRYPDGRRGCRACTNEAGRAYRARLRGGQRIG